MTDSIPLPILAAGLTALAVIAAGIVIDIQLFTRWRLRRPDAGRLAAALRQRPWRLHDAAVLVLVLAGLYMALLSAAGALQHFSGIDLRAHPQLAALLQTACFHIPAILTVGWLLRRGKRTWRTAFGIRAGTVRRHAAQGIMAYIAVLPATVAIGLAYRILLEWRGFPMSPQQAVSLFTQTGPLAAKVLLGGIAIIVAPIAEEILFRGILLPLALRWMRIPTAILGVSLCFACIHLHIPSIAPLFVIAVGFSLVYLYTGSLTAPIVMHMTFNAVSLLAVLLAEMTGGL